MNQKIKPPLYRLTLTMDAIQVALRGPNKKLFKPTRSALRPDGRIDVGITFGLLDQLQTAALPKENLSDTVLRIMAPKGPANVG
jgi:hypothetical protein